MPRRRETPFVPLQRRHRDEKEARRDSTRMYTSSGQKQTEYSFNGDHFGTRGFICRQGTVYEGAYFSVVCQHPFCE